MHKSFCWFCHAAAHILDEVPSYDLLFFVIPLGIKAEGYIIFVFSFVHSYVRWFVLPSRSWNYFKGVYNFRLFVCPFICSLVCTSVPFVELLQSFTCNQQNDLCAQRRLCTQWVAKSARFFMRTAKTDQTGQMPRLICVFLLRRSHFVVFVMRLLTY